MRQPQGYSVITGPAPGTGEWDTITCAHCNAPRRVQPMAPASEMPNVCHLCGDKHRPSFLCEKQECNAGCDPFEEKLKRHEARNRFRCELVA